MPHLVLEYVDGDTIATMIFDKNKRIGKKRCFRCWQMLRRMLQLDVPYASVEQLARDVVQ
ncbi:hypothetical protein [Anoxybacillus sp. TBDG-1]